MARVRTRSHTTIADVAQRAGVSIATVSRVTNQTATVDPTTIERVKQAMRELHYIPRTAARSLAMRKTHTLGLLLTDIRGDFFTPMLSGIEAGAREAGFNLLISTSGHQDAPVGLLGSLGPHNTDGLLVFADSLGDAGLGECYESGYPVVLIHQAPPKGLNIPCVTVENRAAARQLVEHLVEAHGRRRIVFLRGPAGQQDSYWREQGYREALAARRLPFDLERLAQGDFNRDVARASIQRLCQMGVDFDAVFAGDDESAVGALSALRENGRRVPEDVAVVGFDDQRMAAFLTPPLTTVRAPTERVGYEAARQLVQLIRGGTPPPITLLPTELVIRRSCGCGRE